MSIELNFSWIFMVVYVFVCFRGAVEMLAMVSWLAGADTNLIPAVH